MCALTRSTYYDTILAVGNSHFMHLLFQTRWEIPNQMNKNLNEHSFVLQLADTPELYDIIERDIFIMI